MDCTSIETCWASLGTKALELNTWYQGLDSTSAAVVHCIGASAAFALIRTCLNSIEKKVVAKAIQSFNAQPQRDHAKSLGRLHFAKVAFDMGFAASLKVLASPLTVSEVLPIVPGTYWMVKDMCTHYARVAKNTCSIRGHATSKLAKASEEPAPGSTKRVITYYTNARKEMPRTRSHAPTSNLRMILTVTAVVLAVTVLFELSAATLMVTTIAGIYILSRDSRFQRSKPRLNNDDHPQIYYPPCPTISQLWNSPFSHRASLFAHPFFN